MNFTNGQWADIIDALQIAVEDLKCNIRSYLPVTRNDYEPEDLANFNDWDGRIKRYSALRKQLLSRERQATR